MSEEKDKKEPEDIVVRREAEKALAHANELLDGFDALYNDPEKRRKTTVPSGIIVGSAFGNLAMGSNTTDPAERLDQTQKGFTTLIEVLFGAMLGYNARMQKGK